MGKNKVMAVALGTSEEDEAQPNLHLLADVCDVNVSQS
jgi:hypothetical protein